MSLHTCTCILFADDATVFYPYEHIPTLLNKVENELGNLLIWYKSIKLSLKVNKVRYLTGNIKLIRMFNRL